MENILSSEENSAMQYAGSVAGKILRSLKKEVRPGVSTKDIEMFFDKFINKYSGMKAAFKGYNGYPASVCISVNDEVIHGIPSKTRVLAKGDLVGVDLGIEYKGIFVDCAYTYPAGSVSADAKKLLKVGALALKRGIEQARIGNRIGDIGHAVQECAEKHGFSVVRRFVGHGIGRQLHCSPEVPNFGSPNQGELITEGMVLAIEPMLIDGSYQVDVMDDGWTAKTRDGSLSSHFEHTVAITRKGPRIITK